MRLSMLRSGGICRLVRLKFFYDRSLLPPHESGEIPCRHENHNEVLAHIYIDISQVPSNRIRSLLKTHGVSQ